MQRDLIGKSSAMGIRMKDFTMCRHITYQAPAKGQMTKATMLTTHSAKRVAHATTPIPKIGRKAN
jgi:hypothetical protein